MENFINKPFLPEGKVSLVLIDSRIDDEFKHYLTENAIEYIEVPPCGQLYEAVSCHPDMQCHPIGGSRIIAAPNVSESLKNQLIHHGFEIIMGNTTLEGNYPKDIAYNVARIGDVALHNTAYTDPVLKRELDRQGVKWIHVKQGYTKCSVAVVSEQALITSDRGIADAARENKLDVLLINPGFILLEGLNYGFIGGACGLTDEAGLTFIGDVSSHPDYEEIFEFVSKHGKRIKSLKSICLSDYGSMIPLKTGG